MEGILKAIIGWVSSNQIIAWFGTAIVSIAAVSTLINKYSPKIRRALRIADELLDVANAILDAAEDKKITKEEIELIAQQVEELQKALK